MQGGKILGYIHGERVRISRDRCRSRRVTVESRFALDINELHRAKAFRESCWTSFPNFGLIHPDVLRLRACRNQAEIYVATGDGPQRQTVPIVWTHCRIGTRGGWRPWFRCKCGQRAGKLYNAGTVLACRKCCNLIYECQLKSAKGRLQRAATKIRRRLSWVERHLAFKDKLPPRPHGMRTAKYRKLIYGLIAIDKKIALREQKRAIERPKYKRG
jgi:hypothetical protein